MNIDELPYLIRQRFTPFAFLCECEGADTECHRTRTQDTYAIAAHETIERIASFIEDYSKEGVE
jgi:hypothetical protein